MNTKFESLVLIDSLFVKQTIDEARKTYPNLNEADISIQEIIEKIVPYTNLKNYLVYYFEIPLPALHPDIKLKMRDRTIKIKGKSVQLEIIEADFIAKEISECFLANESKFSNVILVGDDAIYDDYLGDTEFPNLTVFRRRAAETRMGWTFHGQYSFLEDLIDAICKTT